MLPHLSQALSASVCQQPNSHREWKEHPLNTDSTDPAKLLVETKQYRAIENSLIETLKRLGYQITPPAHHMRPTDGHEPHELEAEHDEMEDRLSEITCALGLPGYLFMTSGFVSDHWTRTRDATTESAEPVDPDWDVPIPPPPF